MNFNTHMICPSPGSSNCCYTTLFLLKLSLSEATDLKIVVVQNVVSTLNQSDVEVIQYCRLNRGNIITKKISQLSSVDEVCCIDEEPLSLQIEVSWKGELN